MTTHTVYLASIRTAKRTQRTARFQRHIAYHLDYGFHGEAACDAPGWYRWYPHANHRGWLVEAAALVIGPRVQAAGRP